MFTWSQEICLHHPNPTNIGIFHLCMGSSYITASNISLLEKVQRRAARWVTSSYDYHQSVTTLLNYLSWPSLQQRRLYSKLLLFHKIIHHSTALTIPSYYSSLPPLTRRYHALRFTPPFSATTSYQHSFYPDTIKKWNNLPNELLNISSYNQFSTDLYRHLFT